MSFSLSNRALLRAMLAGAVVLTGTACSRSDRIESGSDTSAAVLPDTSYDAAQPTGTDTGTVGDTANQSSTNSPQPGSSTDPSSPRAETAPADSATAGYRSMERDTMDVSGHHAATVDASVEVADTKPAETASAADSTVTTEVASVDTATGADTAAAGYVEMARDTSTVADQADTAATPSGDVALQTTIDSSAQVDADVSTEVADSADTTGSAGRIRPTEDSAEIAAQTTDSTNSTEITTTDEAVDETADEQIINPEDQETVVASETPTDDEVGAAAVAGNLTGADAVALLSRGGVRCALVDSEANEAVRWDMSSTPVGLNPCGMGSMVLSRIWTQGE